LARSIARGAAMTFRSVISSAAAALALAGTAGTLLAQPAYPYKAIHVVVPYPPGGGGDLHGRLIGERLSALLGQPVVVENRSGAAGNTGSDYVAKAAPDGYTLLVNTNALAVSQAIGKSPFNLLTDLAPLSVTMTSQNMLVARAGLPVSSIKELIAYARANPGKLSYGASGMATPMLSAELFKSLAGINLLFVPYKGDAPGIADLLGGQTDLFITNILPLQPHYRAGKVKALAVTSRKRAASLPEVPTMEEAGVPGFDVESWFGFLAPGATPRPIVERLNAALAKVVAMPEVRAKIAESGGVPVSTTPEEFGARIRADVEKFAQIVKSANIKVD
jgi:tripartite-type tricarboxylate transporter receptor subunit TctC